MSTETPTQTQTPAANAGQPSTGTATPGQGRQSNHRKNKMPSGDMDFSKLLTVFQIENHR